MSLSDCQAACKGDRSCEGFISVYYDEPDEAEVNKTATDVPDEAEVNKTKSGEPGPCYKRKNLHPWKCENAKYHSLFIKTGGMKSNERNWSKWQFNMYSRIFNFNISFLFKCLQTNILTLFQAMSMRLKLWGQHRAQGGSWIELLFLAQNCTQKNNTNGSKSRLN